MSGLRNDEKSKQKDKALKNNTDRLYFEEISVHLSKITDHCAFCPLSQSLPNRLQMSIFLLPNDFTRFGKVSTRNISTVLKLFLNFSQSEPLVLMKWFL